MFGKNPIRKPLSGDGSTLEIQEIFFTFQGEGPYVGWPSVFIRLGGCNLACAFCDTEFEQYTTMSLTEILTEVAKLAIGKLIIITGGEPFRQPIEALCSALLAQGYLIQIETNGTLFRPIDARVDIICSPKNTGQGYHMLRADLRERITALKFLVSASDPRYNHVAEVGQSDAAIPVYVQPMDEYDPVKNKENRDYALKLATEKGYRISLQLHKIMGIA